MNNSEELEWLVKCKKCKHCYQIKADSDEVRCRLKDCRYEPKQKPYKAEREDKGVD